MPVKVTIYNDDEAGSREIEVVHIPLDGRAPLARARCLPGDSPSPQTFDLEKDDMLIVKRVS